MVLHIITLPWKLIFATVAPTSYCGVVVLFLLYRIAIVTAFIGDLAALMGCCLGLKDVVHNFCGIGHVYQMRLPRKRRPSMTIRRMLLSGM